MKFKVSQTTYATISTLWVVSSGQDQTEYIWMLVYMKFKREEIWMLQVFLLTKKECFQK